MSLIANAKSKPELQPRWRDLKRQKIDNIQRVKQVIAEEIKQDCF